MYIWLFSRSVGAGRAITRKTRGLTRSVIALIVPPLPAPSRPSKTTQTLRPLCFTHSWSLTSSTWSRSSSLPYSLFFSLPFERCPTAVAFFLTGFPFLQKPHTTDAKATAHANRLFAHQNRGAPGKTRTADARFRKPIAEPWGRFSWHESSRNVAKPGKACPC